MEERMKKEKLCCEGHDLIIFFHLLILFIGVFGIHIYTQQLKKSGLTPLILKNIFKNIIYFFEISKVQKLS